MMFIAFVFSLNQAPCQLGAHLKQRKGQPVFFSSQCYEKIDKFWISG